MRWRGTALGIMAAGAAALAWGCARPPDTVASEVRGSALGAHPKGSVALVVLEVKSLREGSGFAAWMQSLASRLEKQEALQQIKARFGPQIVDRLDRLSLAVAPMGDSRMGYAVIAEGRYEEAALRQSLGGQDSLTLLEIDGQPDLTAAVLSGGALALGPRSVLDEVRANRARSGAGLAANATLMGLLDGIRPAAQAWGAIDYRPLLNLTHGLAESKGIRDLTIPGASAAETLVALSFQASFGQRLDLEVTGRADAEANARNLADTVRGLVALARMGAGQDQTAKAWLDLLDAIGVDQKGTEVILRASIPEATLSLLAERMASAPAAAPSAGVPEIGAAPETAVVRPPAPAASTPPAAPATKARAGSAPPSRPAEPARPPNTPP